MGAPDEALEQLMTALASWNYAAAFPVGYAGTKAPMLMDSWPYDLLDNILIEQDGVMTQPIVAVIAAMDNDRVRSFGDNQFAGGTGTKAMGVDLAFVVSCWADERMGGGPTAMKLAGQVQGCVFGNRNTLAAFRRLTCKGGPLAYEERPQMWRAELTVTGTGVNSYT